MGYKITEATNRKQKSQPSNPVGQCTLTLLIFLNPTFNFSNISSLSQDPFCFDSCSMNIKISVSKAYTLKIFDIKQK